MGELNTNSSNNVEAVTSLTNAATIRKLLRKPDVNGKSNFEILQVRGIPELANGHNCEVTLRVDLAFGHTRLPIPENERYSKRTETVRRIDLKEVAELAGLTVNDKNQYVGTVTDVESVATLLKANIGEEDITIAAIQDVFWIRAKAESVGFIGGLTVAASGAPAVVSATKITRVNEPNAWTEYKLKLTYESSYGASDSDGVAQEVNAGEMVNLIIRTTGLEVAQPITLEVSNPGVSIDFDTSHTITTDGDIVVPLIINSAANTNPTQIKLMINGRSPAATAAFTVL